MVNETTTDSLWESTEAIHGPLYESPEAAKAAELLELHSSNEEAEYPFTIDQVDGIAKLYGRNPDGSATLTEFAKRFSHQIGGYVGADWCSMHIGIEACGHTHS
jgi:hypothetical protein